MVHEVVAAQIIDGDPPEMFETAQRLLALGRDLHEVQHMLGSTIAAQIWTATHEARPASRTEHAQALAALPGSWDDQPRPPNRAERRARSAARRPRRR